MSRYFSNQRGTSQRFWKKETGGTSSAGKQPSAPVGRLAKSRQNLSPVAAEEEEQAGASINREALVVVAPYRKRRTAVILHASSMSKMSEPSHSKQAVAATAESGDQAEARPSKRQSSWNEETINMVKTVYTEEMNNLTLPITEDETKKLHHTLKKRGIQISIPAIQARAMRLRHEAFANFRSTK